MRADESARPITSSEEARGKLKSQLCLFGWGAQDHRKEGGCLKPFNLSLLEKTKKGESLSLRASLLSPSSGAGFSRSSISAERRSRRRRAMSRAGLSAMKTDHLRTKSHVSLSPLVTMTHSLVPTVANRREGGRRLERRDTGHAT
jgi:hypothetical protein